MKSSCSTDDDVEMADLRTGGIERPAIEHDRLGQVHAGHDADAFAVAHEQRVDIALAHQLARRLDRRVAVDEHGRMRAGVPHAGAQDGLDALRAPWRRRSRRACARAPNRRRRRSRDCAGSACRIVACGAR